MKKMGNEWHREYNIKRYYHRRQEFITMLGGKCTCCSSTENLEFDHIDPATKCFSISDKILSYSKSKVLIELKKCQLLCDSCHNLKTLKDKGQISAKATHGTVSSYRYCKCPLCKQAKSDYMKTYKAGLPERSKGPAL